MGEDCVASQWLAMEIAVGYCWVVWVVWVWWVMIWVGVGFGLVGGGGLISIGVILVGNGVVSGCSSMGLVV